MKIHIVFYHPKNPLNLQDTISVASEVSADIIVVKRPGHNYGNHYTALFYDDLVDAVLSTKCKQVLLLETYGSLLLWEAISTIKHSECVIVLIGAEDYGVPLWEVERLQANTFTVITAKIPVNAVGMSYNVVSALIMALYELMRQCGNCGEG